MTDDAAGSAHESVLARPSTRWPSILVAAPREGRLHRVESLDILRGLMALAVAFYHLNIANQAFTPGGFVATTAAKAGHYAVEGFFIISGFCFFYLYSVESFRGDGLKNFHIKRFLRIAPLYYLAVLLNLWMHIRVGPTPNLRYFVENVSLTFGLFHPNHSLVQGGWSIGIEYVFYLCLPLLVWASARSRVFLTTAALVSWIVSLHYTLAVVPHTARAGEQNFHAYVQIGNQAFLFFLGGMVAQLRSRLPWRLTTPIFVVLLGALAAAFTLGYRGFEDHFVIMQGLARYYFVLLCFALVALFAFKDFAPSRAKRIGVFLGEISYSVYLLHPFVARGLERWCPPSVPPLGILSIGMIATLGLAALVHRLLERPAIELGRRLTARAPRPARSAIAEGDAAVTVPR